MIDHQVMNCKDYDPAKFRGGALSPKADGVRAYHYPGQKYLWSRNFKPIYGVGHIVKDLEAQQIPYPVDMELFIPGMEFNELSGIVRNHLNTPEIIAGVIDVVAPGFIAERLKFRPLPTASIRLLENYVCKTKARRDALHQRFLAEGWEGSVLKTFDHLYENRRSYDWMRDVPVKSEDCECLGVYEGKGKMSGMAGGIYIRFQGLEGKCGTMKGMTYDDRIELLENADDYMGVFAEIQYKNLQPSGLPRQPRFKGWRWDK